MINETVKAADLFSTKPAKKTLKYTVDGEAVKVVDGVVTPVKTGEATITASSVYAKAPATVTVKVVNKITEFKAQTPKKLTVKFAGAVKVTKDNFVLTDATGTKLAIKNATTDTTGTIVTLDLYNELASGKTYTVTATVDKVEYKENLAFVKGAVDKIVAVNQVVKAGSNEKIVYTVYDENGLDITDSTVVNFISNVTIINGEVNLANGVLAYVTISYVNPTTGAEIKSDTFTVTGATAVAATIDSVTVKTGDGSATPPTDKNWPATPVLKVTKGDTTGRLYALYTTQFGAKNVATNGNNVSFESLDSSILVVDNATGALTTIAEGVAQVKVTMGSVSNVFSITVAPAAKATSLKVDAGSTLKASLTNPGNNNASVTVNVLDQNQEKVNGDAGSNVLTYTLTSGEGVVEEATKVNNTVSATAGVARTFTPAKAGTAIFKVTSNNSALGYIMVAITVYGTDDVVVGYKLNGVKDLDINHAYDNDANTNDNVTSISLVPVNKDGFTVSANTDAVSGAAITVKKADGTVVATGTEVDLDVTGNVNAEGKYSVTATKGGATLATAEFSVKDSGVKPVVTLKKNAITSGTDVTDGLFDISDDTYNVTGIKFVSGDTSKVASTGNTAVTSISKSGTGSVTLYNVEVVITNTTSQRTYTIAMNQYITVE